MNGGFKYRRIKVGGDERYADTPDKSIYSHVVEAAEYALVGSGVGYQVLQGANDGDDYAGNAGTVCNVGGLW